MLSIYAPGALKVSYDVQEKLPLQETEEEEDEDAPKKNASLGVN